MSRPAAKVNGITLGSDEGVNTATLSFAFRDDVTIVGGGGNEAVVQTGITSDLVSVDTVRFIDGSTYEDNGAVGAQAALQFKGIFGRLPDAINAGGYALVAQQQGTVQAATQMLATAEAQGATAPLSNTAYVQQLYQNILGRPAESAASTTLSNQLDKGTISRGWVAAEIAASPEAQTVNAASFASNAVFAADTGSVEVLRAYEVLLNRLPEASSLAANTAALDSGLSLNQLYNEIMQSPEFLNHATPAGGSDAVYLNSIYPPGSPYRPNPYGITHFVPVANAIAFAHSDQITQLVTPLVTANGGVSHLPG